MKKNKKLNANDIISTRKRLDSEIATYWSFIKAENTLRNNALKFRTHNLLELYNQITQKIEHRILIKGLLNNLNNDKLSFSSSEFMKTHYYNVFRLQECQEQITKLNEIRKRCLAPQLKAQKGKKALGYNEVFTHEKISSIINKLELMVASCKSAIAKYNDETQIEIIDNSLDAILAA